MKIVVISDTHMPKKAKTLPSKLIEGLGNVDLIIHGGDWTSLDIYDELKAFAPVIGVRGNVDPPDLPFEEKLVIEKNGYKIGVVHGHMGKKKTTPERALESFLDQSLDLIIFGHSHIPYKHIHGDTILFNPGSPTDKRVQPQFSFGKITIGDKLDVTHCYFDSKD